MEISNKKQKIGHYSRKRIIIVILLAVIACGVAVGTAYLIGRINETSTPSPANSSQGATGTSTHSKSTKTNDNVNTVPATSHDISMTIVDASQYGDEFEVRAYANVTEDGMCRITFTQGSNSFTRDSIAVSNANTSSCKTVDIQISDFPSTGNWQLTIAYTSSSGKYSGSAAKTITVK